MNECKHPASGRGNYYSMDVLGQFPIAMAYVPWQRFGQTYDLSKALCVGTIFPELDKPFCGKRGVCK
jgi:hypothetical protein